MLINLPIEFYSKTTPSQGALDSLYWARVSKGRLRVRQTHISLEATESKRVATHAYKLYKYGLYCMLCLLHWLCGECVDGGVYFDICG